MFKNLPTLPSRAGDRQTWGLARDAAVGLSVSDIAKAHQGLTLVITPSSQIAEKLQHELGFFLDDTAKVQPIEQLFFPDWETLPYDSFSPHQDIISERLHTLYRLPKIKRAILIVSVTTLMHRLTPVSHLLAHSLILKVGDEFKLREYTKRFLDAGYLKVETVTTHGQFAVRGSIVDLFPMGSKLPYRIDLLDDCIDTLRTFDAESQRSIEKINHIYLLPAREYPLDAKAKTHFKNQFLERFDINIRDCPIYQDIMQSIPSPGAEYYLPLFFDQTATLFDYLSKDTLLVTVGDIETASHELWHDSQTRYENLRFDVSRPILPPKELFLDFATVRAHSKLFPEIQLADTLQKKQTGGYFNLPTKALPSLVTEHRQDDPFFRLRDFTAQVGRILLCADSPGRREHLQELLNENNLSPTRCDNWQAFLSHTAPLMLTVAQLDEPLWLPEQNVAFVTEHQLFDSQVIQRRRREKATDISENIVRDLTELKIGAPVVHIDNGVGRYLGLQKLDIGEFPQEFLMLEYADNAKLYVPVSSLHLISRYSGADDALAPLHRLGSDNWRNACKKAEERAQDVAAELLEIYANRAARKRAPIKNLNVDYQAFVRTFPFEETPDQLAAIEAVIEDLKKEQPMDRLVCGDVGFGKTEVAMRATFLTVQNNRQVALLAPTTLLAQQHFESFRDRFADWPITVEVISRFKTQKQADAIQQKIKSGAIDIIIGTHKLLNEKITYKKLGLLVIDEEHRFGVKQKEKIKAMRAQVDILALTATPIPRTLNMALSKIRDLSIIATPPAKRLSIKTFVQPFSYAHIKEALQRELLRGGQAYYLNNDVKTIKKAARELQELLPNARIAIGHGQMRERDLESIMQRFYHKQFNILVCTTIIETGIDVPSANTIIINRADKLGLAQLHQLRGRVGRSHHQAYAYLLTPQEQRSMTADAIKRLEVIKEADSLGAGFMLATHDLEIRGAGEFLGEGQSGQIQTIGFSLYSEMLERAVASLHQEKGNHDNTVNSIFKVITEINLNIPALLPDDYIVDVHTRLVMYKRISSAKSSEALKELQVEMIDRFGLLPNSAKHLFRIMELKLQSATLGIKKIEARNAEVLVEFTNKTTVNPQRLVYLIQNQPLIYSLNHQAMTLKCKFKMETIEQKFSMVQNVIHELNQ